MIISKLRINKMKNKPKRTFKKLKKQIVFAIIILILCLISFYIGKIVKIKVLALNDREVEGIVTDITSTATNGRFTVTIEFDNDGDILNLE